MCGVQLGRGCGQPQLDVALLVPGPVVQDRDGDVVAAGQDGL
jgi:hypothetical protein